MAILSRTGEQFVPAVAADAGSARIWTLVLGGLFAVAW